LEAQNRLLEKQRGETGKALADEKRGKRRTTLCADSFVFKLIDTLLGLEKEVSALKHDLAACEKANTELQKAREAAEAREDATKGKLRLERQAREGIILESPYFLSDPIRGELIETVLTSAEARQLTGKVSVVLAAFEPEGMAAVEELDARLEAARGRLGVFAKGVAQDVA
jgi:hypothetical protein